jgi:hypothetical protein
MANRRRKRKSPKVPFPRRQWEPGQAPRVEKPKKGRGAYDRTRASHNVRGEAESEM